MAFEALAEVPAAGEARAAVGNLLFMTPSRIALGILLTLSSVAMPNTHASSHVPTLSVHVRQPPSASVPLGAQRVEMLQVTLTASCAGSAKIDTIHVIHGGMGLAEDLQRLYVLMNRRRISRTSTLSEKNPSAATLRFSSFIIPACETQNISIVADIRNDALASGEHLLTIPDDGIVSNSTVVMNANEQRETIHIVSAEQGAITVTYPSLLLPVRYGPSKTVARLLLQSEGSANLLLSSLELTNQGSASNDDLRNLRIVGKRGEALSNILPHMSGSTARFTFSPPIPFDAHDNILVSVVADVHASRRRTIRFTVDEPSDMEVYIQRRSDREP